MKLPLDQHKANDTLCRYSTRESSEDTLESDTMASTCHDLIDPLSVPTPFPHPSSPISSFQPHPSIHSQPSITSPLNVFNITTPPYNFHHASQHHHNPLYDPSFLHFYRHQIDNHQRRMSQSCLGLSHSNQFKSDFATATKSTQRNEDYDSDDASIRTSRLNNFIKSGARKFNVNAQIHAAKSQQSLQPPQPQHRPKRHKSHRQRQQHKQQRHQIRYLQQSQPLFPMQPLQQPHALLNPPEPIQMVQQFPQHYPHQLLKHPFQITHQQQDNQQHQHQQIQLQQQQQILQSSEGLRDLEMCSIDPTGSMGRTTIV